MNVTDGGQKGTTVELWLVFFFCFFIHLGYPLIFFCLSASRGLLFIIEDNYSQLIQYEILEKLVTWMFPSELALAKYHLITGWQRCSKGKDKKAFGTGLKKSLKSLQQIIPSSTCHMVFYLFSRSVIYLVIRFSSYSVPWIWFNGPAGRNNNNIITL